MNIQTVIDQERGCGWREEGGLYMRSEGLATPCGRLPVPCTVCPCCGAGIKHSLGFTWIQPRPLFDLVVCNHHGTDRCTHCPLGEKNMPERAGLIWVGEKFYKTPQDFEAEAAMLGVSRRIPAVPNGFKIGETWVFLAHIKGMVCPDCHGTAISQVQLVECPTCKMKGMVPAIFHAFKPSRIEYVVKGDEDEETLERMVKRGITPVKIQRAGQTELAV